MLYGAITLPYTRIQQPSACKQQDSNRCIGVPGTNGNLRHGQGVGTCPQGPVCTRGAASKQPPKGGLSAGFLATRRAKGGGGSGGLLLAPAKFSSCIQCPCPYVKRKRGLQLIFDVGFLVSVYLNSEHPSNTSDGSLHNYRQGR